MRPVSFSDSYVRYQLRNHPKKPDQHRKPCFTGRWHPFCERSGRRNVLFRRRALARPWLTSRGAFVAAVNAVQRFLVPFDTWSLLDYGLFGHDDGEPKLSYINDAEKAAALLRLLGSTIGTAPSAVVPYDLGDALSQIEEVAPGLIDDPTYRRLATAARR